MAQSNTLLSENNTYYTGYTNALDKRYQSHLKGTGKCKYTRSFKPLKIAQAWEVIEGKKKAMQLESLIKKLTRREKEILIAQPSLLFKSNPISRSFKSHFLWGVT
ncbi:MAG: GIY-YIG nuclease family protein [Legionella sp.]|nr:GIY-YIG nuclease family protein [Legionella sp.]